MLTEDIARVAHEINRAYCQALGDDSQPTWDDAPEWQRSSAIDGVRFHLANPDAGPDASHNNWLKQKEDDGWVYGPEKNPEKKEHPCFVPYDQLPVEQRAKDFLFRQVVHSLKGDRVINEVVSTYRSVMNFSDTSGMEKMAAAEKLLALSRQFPSRFF